MAQAATALTSTPASQEGADRTPGGSAPEEYPVREYIGAMALELAQMARWDGDDALGDALDAVSEMAAAPRPRAGADPSA